MGVRYEVEGRIERTTGERARGQPLDLLALQFTVKEFHRQRPNREDNWERPESGRLIPHPPPFIAMLHTSQGGAENCGRRGVPLSAARWQECRKVSLVNRWI